MVSTMNVPDLLPEQIARISGLVAQYIRAQQDAYRANGVSLSNAQKEAMRGFFSEDTLERVQLVTLAKARVGNPDFYPMLRGLGFNNLIDFSQMAAITFENVIVSHETFSNRLLFHELVHVEQYHQLGVNRFADLYVRGFLAGGGYDGIPLETEAYTLDESFHHAPTCRFDVAAEVARGIAANRL